MKDAPEREAPQRLVLDASVAVALVREERISQRAWHLVADGTRMGTELVAPSLLWLEVANVLVPRSPSPSATVEALHRIERLGVRTVQPDQALLLLSIGYAHAWRLTPYDGLYLALAETEGARLVTADRALATAAGPRGVLLGDWSAGAHEVPARYGGDEAADADDWPGLDAYTARLREEVAASG